MTLKYLSGFGNHHSTEAIPGTLPAGQNSPQEVAHGLYAEQLSGSPFTSPRAENFRSWLYRIQPSVFAGGYESSGEAPAWQTALENPQPNPTAMRWDPMPYPAKPVDLMGGLTTLLASGSPRERAGLAFHLYAAAKDRPDAVWCNADGEMVFVPQEGGLRVRTEFGLLEVEPTEIAVIPRGVKFQVSLPEGKARGYVGENFGAPFRLPYLGPIGANGLANPRDFLAPVASFEDRRAPFELFHRFLGRTWRGELAHSPLDVVGWHGNLYPYKYDLKLFSAVNTVTFDHPDPSIFTVLTSPTPTPGLANSDFVIFPERWMVAEHTFRPPYYHRNVMSEAMGLIRGTYDAKAEGFLPGATSLHNGMTPHGPDVATFTKASKEDLVPAKQARTLAFMFEGFLPFAPTPFGQKDKKGGGLLQADYVDCWKDLPRNFESP